MTTTSGNRCKTMTCRNNQHRVCDNKLLFGNHILVYIYNYLRRCDQSRGGVASHVDIHKAVSFFTFIMVGLYLNPPLVILRNATLSGPF